MTWILTLWTAAKSKLAGYVVAIAAVLAILTGAYLKGRQDNAASSASARLRTANKARKIEDEVNGLGGDDVDAALRKWMRDK